jgi:ribonuclease HI
MLIEVYSDGSGNTFDSDGGYGWRLVVDGVLFSEGNGYLPRATNNVAEITAAIKGLEAQLVLGYANGSYKCKALHLSNLYISLRKIYGSLKANARWVRGHNGDEHNEGCDKLAKAARNGKGVSGLVQSAIPGTEDTAEERDGDGETV